MNRTELITELVTNCDCWKGDQKTLDAFTDEKLTKLHENHKKTVVSDAVINTLSEGIVVNGVNIKLQDTGELDVTTVEDDDEEEEEEEEEDVPTLVKNRANYSEPDEDDTEEPITRKKGKKVMTANQWLESAPPEIQSVVTNALKVMTDQKRELVLKLVANHRGTADGKEALAQKFMKKSIEDLQELFQLLPQPTNNFFNSSPTANFFGAQGAAPQHDEQPMEDLPILTVNWSEDLKTNLVSNGKRA